MKAVFCPNCKDEFRAGFTRCEGCDVELVEDLAAAEAASPTLPEAPPPMPIDLADFCGFFSLEEARSARERLRVERIHSEIVIREIPGGDWDGPPEDEFWIRVDKSRAKEVVALLGETRTSGSSETFSCGECGKEVAVEESFCPGCGARFEDP